MVSLSLSLSQFLSPFCFSTEQYAIFFERNWDVRHIEELNTCFIKALPNDEVKSRAQILEWLNGCESCWLDKDDDGEKKDKPLWDPNSKDHNLKKCYDDTQAKKKIYDKFTSHIKRYNGGEFLSFATK